MSWTLGFTLEHVFFMLLMAGSALLGNLVRVVTTYWKNLTAIPEGEPTPRSEAKTKQWKIWIKSNLVISFVMGWFFGLYLLESLADGIDVIARVLVISAILGWAGPEAVLRRVSLPSLVAKD